jgi:hypothetical protein
MEKINRLDKEICNKCKGAGVIREKNGTVHTCYDCLQADRLEQHGKPKETNIKL